MPLGASASRIRICMPHPYLWNPSFKLFDVCGYGIRIRQIESLHVAIPNASAHETHDKFTGVKLIHGFSPQVSHGRALKSFRMLLDRRQRLVNDLCIILLMLQVTRMLYFMDTYLIGRCKQIRANVKHFRPLAENTQLKFKVAFHGKPLEHAPPARDQLE